MENLVYGILIFIVVCVGLIIGAYKLQGKTQHKDITSSARMLRGTTIKDK